MIRKKTYAAKKIRETAHSALILIQPKAIFKTPQ